MKYNNKIILFVIAILIFSITILPVNGTYNQVTTLTKQKITKLENNTFDEEILYHMKKGHMPSISACIIKNNSVLWSKGYGYANINKEILATENTTYLIASITKTITATAIMQLWEKGLFKLDDDVNDYLPFSLRNPKYPNHPITFRMLLAHHSSLSEKAMSLFIYFSLFNLPIKYLEEYLVESGNLYRSDYWTEYPPGKQLVYSSIGFEVLGYLVELLSGKPLEKYCQENIFKPLDMNNTSFKKNYFDIKKLARPYIWILNSTYLPLFHINIDDSASGGVRTSVMDLSHFLIANMNNGTYKNNRILKEETIKLIRTRQYPGNDSTNRYTYGLGWRLSLRYRNNSYGHSGAIPGALTNMYYNLENNSGIIFFSNQYPLNEYKDLWSFINILFLLYEKADNL